MDTGNCCYIKTGTAAVFLLLFLFFSCKPSSKKFFESLPPSGTHIDFANNLEKRKDLDILRYIYYYNGGGVAIGDVNNDGLPDIYFSANSKGNNKLYLNKGNFEFEDITQHAGVAGTSDWCTGVTMADVNGDGLLDIYVCAIANMHGLEGHNELFINNGNGTFTERAQEYGLGFSGFSTQAVFFDYDHDGDLDCFILNQSEHPNQNIGDTSLRRKFDANAGERLFRNDRNTNSAKFTDVSAQAGIYQSSLCYGLGVAVGDFNNDGWDDIYVSNDFHENDYYYLNNGNGTFTESGAKHFKHYSRFSMGNDAADFNNDGQLDLVTTDMLPPDEKTLKTYGNGEHLDIYQQKITKNGYQNQVSRNCLQKNNGDGISFSDIGLMSGVYATDWSWSPLFADFDNDGNKDLFISTGIPKRPVDLDFAMYFANMGKQQISGSQEQLVEEILEKIPDGATHPYFFKGDGKMHFADSSQSWGTSDMQGYYNGAAYGDLNNDGNLDIIMNCLNANAIVFKNNAPKKNYLSVAFKGNDLNTFGIGCKSYVFSKGKMQYQQLMLTRGFESSCETRLHFGLNDAISVDSILVVWPDQKFQWLKNVAANQQLTVLQKDAAGFFDHHILFPPQKEILKDITATVNCLWRHKENAFTDFDTQYLLPHQESKRGPKIAVADINKDGLDDMYLCGAKGQRGALMVQQKNGSFIEIDTSLFAKYILSENVDAVFFDANNDGYPDLYVVNGGNEYEDGNTALADHLFINDKKGHFKEATNALPPIYVNKTCVTIADVNHDGAQDIFVGGFAPANKYGYAQNSYMLLNDGKGNFKLAGGAIISLHETGMVTSACFADLNNDGWPDLVVSGEWMPLKIYINSHGKFTETNIPRSSGLWETVVVTDINGDGYSDILAGNWGQNSKLYSGKNGPLKLFVKDFDNNGTVQQIMAYTIDGKEYSFLGKDQLEIVLPVLKKMHYTYKEVAGQTVQFLFGDLLKDCKTLQAETLSSTCFMNDGHGNFSEIKLPQEMQMAPLFAFDTLSYAGKKSFIGGGNFYGVLPYEGRYDASVPTIFSFNNNAKQFVIGSSLPSIDGEVRDIRSVRVPGRKNRIILCRNDQPLIFLERAN